MAELHAQHDDEAHKNMWPESLRAYDLTLETAAENLALDEALLNDVEADPTHSCLRFWESQEYFVVLGRSNRAESEVNVDHCRNDRVPILRRASGGGTVLVGPGCLCYTLALPLTDRHRSLGISLTTSKLMENMAAGLSLTLPGVAVRGTSDLVLDNRKFSGNAQKWLRRSFLHHGTFFYDFNLPLVSHYLSAPSRQPEYRESRSHLEFVTNISLNREQLSHAVSSIWNAKFSECPAKQVEQSKEIAKSRSSSKDWVC